MKLAIVGKSSVASQAVHQLLAPWHVTYTGVEEADLIIAYGATLKENKADILIPSETQEFRQWLKNMAIEHSTVLRARLKIPAANDVALTLVPQVVYQYVKSVKGTESGESRFFIRASETRLLTVDVVGEYYLKMSEILKPELSLWYKVMTGLPIPYTMAPTKVRNLMFWMKKANYAFEDHLTLDALRYLLVEAIETATGRRPRKKRWNGQRCVCMITHDVDTRGGLNRAQALRKIEEKYDFPSTWFIPTEQYKLDRKIVQDLANHGEVAAHDTKHDGRLIQLPQRKIVKRLIKAKRTLEKTVKKEVKGFRAPLMQCHERIFEALKQAGYAYDASTPTWEPKHPCTMKPYGIETVSPLWANDILEIPLTLLQDHQMIHVMGIRPKRVVEEWMRLVKTVKKLGGVCTILVHPEYELTSQQNMRYYKELLEALSGEDECWATTLSQLANHFGAFCAK